MITALLLALAAPVIALIATAIARPARAHVMLDAVSQLVNVAWLPRQADTTANESVSGRAYREGFMQEPAREGMYRLMWVIDTVFGWFGQPSHCRDAYLADIARAERALEQHNAR